VSGRRYRLTRGGQVAPCVRQVDRATLARLTWLWVSYCAFALIGGHRGLPVCCPFRLLTGHRCPLCGLTRSWDYLLRGKVGLSFREHPAGPILFAGSAISLVKAWYAVYRDRDVQPDDPGPAWRARARRARRES
jgi:hypothetical protein